MLLNPIHLAIVDKHVLFRKTLKGYLSEHKNFTVVVQTSNTFELFDQLSRSTVDILLMGIAAPGSNANNNLDMIRTRYPSLKVIVLSMSTDMDLISNMLESGIYGYICKADEPEELINAIRVVSEDRIYRNRLFMEALYWNKQNHISPDSNQHLIHVSDREKKMLQLIWEEKSNKEISETLYLGVRSIEKIRQDLKEKIGASSTVGLIKYAINKGIVIPSGRHSLSEIS
jgi:DNA-binding NarL/FixJ family response regulator